MATTISEKRFIECDEKKGEKLPFEKLFVKSTTGQSISLKDLRVLISIKNNVAKVRPVKSFADFKRELKKNNVFLAKDVNLLKASTISKSDFDKSISMISLKNQPGKEQVKLMSEEVHVPKSYESTVINATSTVPYGLKRNLSVIIVLEKSKKNYMLVEINGKQEFVKKGEIYFYDSNNNKKYLEEDQDFSAEEIKGKDLFTTGDKHISSIYTEKEFAFDAVNAQEKVDLANKTKTTYQLDKNGEVVLDKNNNPVYTTVKLDKYISEQKFIQVEEDDDKNPGKKKKVSKVAVKNYELSDEANYMLVTVGNENRIVKISDIKLESGKTITDMIGKSVELVTGEKTQPLTTEQANTTYTGEYILVSVGNTNKTVKISDIKLEPGKTIKDMVGKSVELVTGEKTEPLTYEQINLNYSVRMNYYKTNEFDKEKSFIRLENGKYVKESDVIEPICYKFANDGNAYLVRVEENGKVRTIIVDDEDEVKKGITKGVYKGENIFKVKRCPMKDCDIIQTVSKYGEEKKCEVLKKFNESENKYEGDNDKDVEVRAKTEFAMAYVKGEYFLEDVYVDGTLEKLDSKRHRYVYSDTMILDDYSEDMLEYRALRKKQLSINKHDMVVGAKYDIGEGIAEGFKTYGKILGYSFGGFIAAGIFVPVAGLVISGIYGVAMGLAIPGIPLWHLGKGLIQNSTKRKYKDKTEYNREKRIKEIDSDRQDLYERMTDKDKYIMLTEEQFIDRYLRLEDKIISLSATYNDSQFNVQFGTAEVTSGNINEAKKYKREYQAETKKLNSKKDKLKKLKERYLKLQKEEDNFKAERKNYPEKKKEKLEKAKAEYEALKTECDALQTKHDSKKLNYTAPTKSYEVHPELENRLRMAKEMRLFVYLKKFKDSEIVKEAMKDLSDKEKELLDTLTLDKDGVVLGHWMIKADESKIEKDVSMTDDEKNAWKSLLARFKNLSSKIETKFKEEKQKPAPVVVKPAESGDDEVTSTPVVPVVTAEVTDEANVNAGPNPIASTNPVNPGDAGGDDGKPKPAPKTRLSKETLETLLANIEELGKLDKLYLQADEEIPNDIDKRIGELEVKIMQDIHLLQKAAKNEKYVKYLTRIQKARNIIQAHQPLKNRNLGSLNIH